MTIEAFQWTGGPDQLEDPVWICEAIRDRSVVFEDAGTDGITMRVSTLEGVMLARPGDWIIRGVEGEIYPCKDSVFQASYVVASRPADSAGAPALSLAEAEAALETQTAPRITQDGITAKIASTEYFRSRTLTICVVTMSNGFHLLGTSACASPENFDQAIGERYAYQDAFRQIWPLEGYLLRERLAASAAEQHGQDDAVEAPRVPRVGAQDTRSRGEPRP
ncbi:Gp49 family protein [Methylobacterium sp. Leaf91]|uniref:Gp49 family protein n=1 Tax=Methylobacterium sp. Leaf91 TaxID=1736247 RepID=UPI001FCCD973|nr:Gp49 family protein [Methylobacterium sp. Leaf91]